MLFPKTVKKIKQTFQKEKDPKDVQKAKELFTKWNKNQNSIENISEIYDHREKNRLSLKDFVEDENLQRSLKTALQMYALETNKGGVSKNTRKRLQKKIGIAA
jgi:hypothetical protein